MRSLQPIFVSTTKTEGGIPYSASGFRSNRSNSNHSRQLIHSYLPLTPFRRTNLSPHGQPKGLYMDNTGLGSGTTTAGFHQNANHYLDWWITTTSNSSNAFTYSRHFILVDNDAGFHTYFVVNHSSSDIAGSLGQIQYVFRISQTLFTNTYSLNSALTNLPPPTITLPSTTVMGNS